MQNGQGNGAGGKGTASVGVPGPLAEQLYKSFQIGTTSVVPDTSWVSMFFSVVLFFFFLFYLFKRNMTKTTWEVCPVFDHFTNPTIRSKAEQRQALRQRFLVME